MKRVFKSCLMVTMGAAVLGLAVTQARADRIRLTGACVSLSCNPESLTVSAASLSFGASSLTLEIVAANSAALEFASNVVGVNDHGVASAGAEKAAKVSSAQDRIKNSGRPTSTAVTLLSNSMLWPFTDNRTAMQVTQTSASSALPTGNGRSGNFSVVAGNVANAPSITSASAKAGTTLQAKAIASSSTEAVPLGSPVPEPTTMLLFGSGLVGAAAILRKRLRGRRPDSKQV
jgi:hypothetical protein